MSQLNYGMGTIEVTLSIATPLAAQVVYVHGEDTPCVLAFATETHGTAGTDGSAVTVDVQVDTGTTVTGSGVSLLSTTFNAKGTLNTPQYGVCKPTRIKKGDRVSVVCGGVLTALASEVVSLVFGRVPG